MKKTLKIAFLIGSFAYALVGCTNKISQTGSWLVTYDSTLVPRYFNSIKDPVKITSSQINFGLANGSGPVLPFGNAPWTEADLLLEFYGIPDTVYQDTNYIQSATIFLERAPFVVQPNGHNVENLQFAGYAMDTSWDYSTATWDSIALRGHETENVILSQAIQDTFITIGISTNLVQQWADAVVDTNKRNYGLILKAQNVSGVLSVYSSLAGTGYEPVLQIVYNINGVQDTVITSSSYSTSVAHTTVTTVAPQGKYRFVQSGTGLRESLLFDLTGIPNYSVVNFAQLRLFVDTSNAQYLGNTPDSLLAYYMSDPSTHGVYTGNPMTSVQVGNAYTFNVTIAIQQMLNRGNYGFLITRYDESSNVGTSFIYNESAADSLRPRLTITYAPVVRK